ncbi:metal-dependent hydrolase [Lucifera butyrica]|uniref:N-acetylglucosamine-6-phosphate deacetylase n=1 Tax=Lucifera butyrica TaxID=1351585 RepID=A0A498R1W4_9FIRM|nr:N-acetylglucosamine-6-phosphate deacetylase [Lucifera butyrica]VBB05371.1 metal-dependent hydrolase [Lucifera butyrica]
MKAIYNANVIQGNAILPHHAVLFTEKILAVVPDASLAAYSVGESYDAAGQYLSPGFVDIHIHGSAGSDTMDKNNQALDRVSESIARTGVTSFLPTTMTMDLSRIETALDHIRTRMNPEQEKKGAEILGAHLEGPFISQTYKGAQSATYILSPDFNKIKQYTDIIRIVTLAPELDGSIPFIEECRRHNIIASIGHSAAEYEEAMAAIAAGASHITHTFNALTPLNHRKPGVVGAAMDSDVTCELIVDNLHVHPAAQRILLKTKGINKIILVTDAMRACLLEDGEYDLGGQTVFVKNNEARLPGGVIAGSVLKLNEAVYNFRQNTGLPLTDVLKAVTVNPAARIGVYDRKGSLDAGKDADMVLFDDQIAISKTFVKGSLIWRRDEQ